MASPSGDMPLPAVPCMRGVRRGPPGCRGNVRLDEPVGPDHVFKVPTKQIVSADQMPLWEKSVAYQEYVGFLLALNDSIVGKTLSDECHVSPATERILGLLDTLSSWVDEIPPVEQPQRFGNKAFRDYYARVKDKAKALVEDVLPDERKPAAEEISLYLEEGLGNSTRIDYGTGHEMSFVMFLCCLFRIGVLVDEDRAAAVLRIFARYLDLARKLQKTYKMEPAGSHGVWSLDDYQFIPFIWGSAQLMNHPTLEPKSFVDPEIAERYASDYLFMGCIKYINEVKTGPFAEHSNQLWHVSGVQSWGKVNQGLMKMYKAEVLAKFPVIQHTFFGSLFTLEPASQTSSSLSRPGMSVGLGARMPGPGSSQMGRMPPPPAPDCRLFSNL